jgi:DNA-binding SARP family transcriptional activator/outer membrane protein assembly factor BamB
LLAILLLRAGEVVSTDRLIQDLWGEDPPSTAPKMVQVFVSRLRSSLEEGGARRVLFTQPPGYVIRIEPDRLDLARFEALAAQARATMSSDPGTASGTLRQALDLWHGPPLADVALEPFAAAAIVRLDELHLSALEDRVDADLALGRHADLVAELRDLVGGNPLRERLRGQLMLTLYRSGRQAEALEVYRDGRAALADALGIDPGPELQRLETAILRQDPSLEQALVAPAAEPVHGEAVTERDPARKRRGPTRVMLAVGAGVAAIALLAAALVSRSGHSADGTTGKAIANSVAVVNPANGKIVADVPVGSQPGQIAVGGTSVWVGNLTDRTVTRIDARSLETIKTFGLADAPVSVDAAGGLVWIGDGYTGRLSRIIAAYDQLSSPFYPGPVVPGQVAVASPTGDLWVGLADGRILRLDPASLRTKATARIREQPSAMAVTGGVAWTIPFHGNDVTRIDPGHTPAGSTIALPGSPVAIAAGDGSVWVGTSGDDRLWQLNPLTSSIEGSVPLGQSPHAIAVAASGVWVAVGDDGLLVRIDPSNDTLTRTIRVGRPIGSIAVDDGKIWATLD